MSQKYDSPQGDPNLGEHSTQDLSTLSAHIARYWGEQKIFHELMSDYVHIDLHVIPASELHPYHAIITTGMSDRRMQSPEGHEADGYAELMLCLPPTWPLDENHFKEKRFWWPFRQLKKTARFPHECNTWLSEEHTIANGNPPEPFADGVGFCCVILSTPKLCPPEACSLQIRPDKRVSFFSLIPLLEKELRFAWAEGSQKLLNRLDQFGVNELIDPNRESSI